MENQNTASQTVQPRLRPIVDNFKDAGVLIYKQWAPLLITQATVMFGTFFVIIISLLIFFTPVIFGLVKGAQGEEVVKQLFTGYFWIGMFFMIIPVIIIGSWGYAAMITAFGYRNTRMAPIGPTLKKGLQLLVPVLLITVITGGATFGAGLMLFVPAIVLCVGLALVFYIIVLENTSVTEAIGTSWEITKGYKWSILGRMLLLMLALWVVIFGLAIISIVPIMGFVVMPVQFALNFVLTPYIFAYFFLIYEDIRAVRKEVYPMKKGLTVFMIIAWVLTITAFSGFVFGIIYLVQTHLMS